MQNNNFDRRVNPENTNYQNKVNTDEIDAIRANEVAQRQRRARHAENLKRQERRRRAKIKRIKTMIQAWATLIGVVVCAIALVIFVVSAIKKVTDKPPLPDNLLDGELSAVAQSFKESQDIIYSSDNNELYVKSNELVNIALGASKKMNVPTQTTDPSAFLWQAVRYSWYSDRTNLNDFKQVLCEFPIFSNGYIWSSEDSMKSQKNAQYLYDTNARYISAVCEILNWETDTSFLYQKDTTTKGHLDRSSGMTVLDKVELAASYYFDKEDLNGGGIRYNEADGLVYILTGANSGLSDGAGSNYWYNHRFGYLDAYNNIAFNEAMTHLSRLYTLLGDTEKSAYYSDIAQKNKDAINKKFWNGQLSRYVGWIDIDGKVHDLGYTFLNLQAVSAGIADKNKTEKIFAWLDGNTKQFGDSSYGKDIYKFGYAPRSNTITAGLSYWDGQQSFDLGYGNYSQNGGASMVTAYYDLKARANASDRHFTERYKAFIDSYSNADFDKAEHAAALSMAVYGLFGINSDGSTLYADPVIKVSQSTVGVKNIGFGMNSYDFAFNDKAVLVFAKHSGAVRLNIGGFEKNGEYTARIVQDNVYTTNEPVKADKDGYIALSERFGADSFLVIQKAVPEKE